MRRLRPFRSPENGPSKKSDFEIARHRYVDGDAGGGIDGDASRQNHEKPRYKIENGTSMVIRLVIIEAENTQDLNSLRIRSVHER